MSSPKAKPRRPRHPTPAVSVPVATVPVVVVLVAAAVVVLAEAPVVPVVVVDRGGNRGPAPGSSPCCSGPSLNCPFPFNFLTIFHHYGNASQKSKAPQIHRGSRSGNAQRGTNVDFR